MRAAIFHGKGQPLTIEKIHIDDPNPHEVVVRTVASGICHSDLHVIEGNLTCPLPAVLGHEAAGIVEKVGALVTYVKPGDHVITCLSVFCGHCKQCLTGHPSCCSSTEVKRDPSSKQRLLDKDNGPLFQFYNIASFAEKILVHENSVVKIDDTIPFECASVMGCAVVTGLGAVFNTAKIEVGSTVAVFGCGGIGIPLIQAAKIAGARTIIAVDIIDNKLNLAKEFGATHTVNAKKNDPVEAIIKITQGGVDYSFECIGNTNVLEQALYSLAPRGTLTLLGLIPENQKIEILPKAFYFERKLQGSRMGSNRFRIEVPTYLEFYHQGQLKLDELISNKIKLEDINDAFAAMKRGEVIRSIIMFD